MESVSVADLDSRTNNSSCSTIGSLPSTPVSRIRSRPGSAASRRQHNALSTVLTALAPVSGGAEMFCPLGASPMSVRAPTTSTQATEKSLVAVRKATALGAPKSTLASSLPAAPLVEPSTPQTPDSPPAPMLCDAKVVESIDGVAVNESPSLPMAPRPRRRRPFSALERSTSDRGSFALGSPLTGATTPQKVLQHVIGEEPLVWECERERILDEAITGANEVAPIRFTRPRSAPQPFVERTPESPTTAKRNVDAILKQERIVSASQMDYPFLSLKQDKIQDGSRYIRITNDSRKRRIKEMSEKQGKAVRIAPLPDADSLVSGQSLQRSWRLGDEDGDSLEDLAITDTFSPEDIKALEKDAGAEYVRLLLEYDEEITFKRYRGPFTAAACRAKQMQLEQQGPSKTVMKFGSKLIQHVRAPEKGKPVGGKSSNESEGKSLNRTYKDLIVKEIENSRRDTFKRYMKVIRERDAARAAGDMVAFENLNKKLGNIDVYNADFHNPEFTANPENAHHPFDEQETRLLVKDLHLYSLYCVANRISLILRDVAPGAASAYQGTFHLPDEYNDPGGVPIYERVTDLADDMESLREMTDHRIKVEGKGITVGLKSSPYEPILGLIPLDPRLSKLVRAFAANVRMLEEQLLKSGDQEGAQTEDMTVSIMKLQKAESETGMILQKFALANDKAMAKSKSDYEALQAKYNKKMQYAFDKGKVSRKWVERFNDARFLGLTHFRSINEDKVYYFSKSNISEIERDEQENPVFVAKCEGKGGDSDTFQIFNQESKNFEDTTPSGKTADQRVKELLGEGFQLTDAQVVVYRKFTLDPITHRIVEDPANISMIVPDYDGLAYCFDRDYPGHVVDTSLPDEENVKSLVAYFQEEEDKKRRTQIKDGMGAVSKEDEIHVHEVRDLTAWKQNHGEEVNNIFKTQDIVDGNYVAFTSDGQYRILKSAAEIFVFYRQLWKEGRPMPLNPKWKVYLDEEGLPVWNPRIDIYDNTLDMGRLQEQVERNNKRWASMSALDNAYQTYFPEKIVKKKQLIKFLQDNAFRQFCLLKDEEKIMDQWIEYKKHQLVPPIVLCKRNREEIDPERADLIDRLMPNVTVAVERDKKTKLRSMQSTLHSQRVKFLEKHNSDCRSGEIASHS